MCENISAQGDRRLLISLTYSVGYVFPHKMNILLRTTGNLVRKIFPI